MKRKMSSVSKEPVLNTTFSKSLHECIVANDLDELPVNFHESQFHDNEFNIHCWSGKRFRITIESLPDGSAFDPKTGDPITVDEFRNRYGDIL